MSRKMSQKKRTGVAIEGKFVPITHNELDSEAFHSLSGSAAKLYILLKQTARTVAHMLSQQERDVVFDFTYKEAKRKGFAERTFIRAIKSLWEVGFIDVVSRGGLRGTGRSNSRYKLSPLWKSYGEAWHDRTKHDADPYAPRTEPQASDVKW